jgi:hypothetical protein
LDTLKCLTKLTSFEPDLNLTNDHLKVLPNLTHLRIWKTGGNMGRERNITDVGLSHMTSLTSLDLQTSAFLPSDINLGEALPNLKKLRTIRKLTEVNISSLESLEELVLLRGPPGNIDSISGLTNLRILHINEGQLYNLDGVVYSNVSSCIRNMTRIEDLVLDRVFVSSETLSGMVGLKRLVMRGQGWDNMEALSYAPFENLTHLTIKVMDGLLIHLKQQVQLRYLSLSRMRLVSGVECLTNLEALRIRDIKNVTNDVLIPLTQLKSLSLRYQPSITSVVMEGMTVLANLHIEDCPLIDMDTIPHNIVLLKNKEGVRV